MVALTHPSVVDGWFREINSQWPGQALTLKVKQILHIEKSQYQDVLVFESETYGNVLILDGVVQCTERDEFAYQEMITHLPMASHPNPEHVLVIGGGDGGVVREVLKHESVKHVTLCDIDEAVVRVSKLYLPHMAALLADPRVTVFIGDGFKFLPDHKNEYDVIITDSSDPVGPAAALFEAPYFTLLKAALKAGGNISTQGECLWLHLPLIKELRETTLRLFPVVEYAFTTIPTYPSGQIGFVCCSLDEKRSVSTPLRKVPGCQYYNENVHKAAFVLPEFGRAMVEDGKMIRPDFSGVRPGAPQVAQEKGKKVLLLGSGFVAGPAAEYIARQNSVTIGCRTLATAESLAAGIPNATAIAVDVSDPASLDPAVAAHDLVVSLVPYTYHAAVIESAIKSKKHVVTTSYVSPAMKALEPQAIEAGIVVMNEMGLDPGIDHLAAVRVISRVHKEGGKIREFYSYCGGLPCPKDADNPLGYSLSWSCRGFLLAARNNAKFLENGKEVEIPGSELMNFAKPYYISSPYSFVAYPNRSSAEFREYYNIPEAHTVVRGTLRFPVTPPVVAAFADVGFLNDDARDWLQKDKPALTWAEVTARAVGAEANSASIISKLKTYKALSGDNSAIIISKLKDIGMFSDEKVTMRGTLLDTLCATLEDKCQYGPGQRDMVMLQHKFVVEKADGSFETITATLDMYGGQPEGKPSAMAFLVGVPCGITVQAVLDGKINTPGVHAPYDERIAALLEVETEKEGIILVEKVL